MFFSKCQISVARDVHSKIEIYERKWGNNWCIDKINSYQYSSNSIFSFPLWKWFDWNLERKNFPFNFCKLSAKKKVLTIDFSRQIIVNVMRQHFSIWIDFFGPFYLFWQIKVCFFFSSTQKRNNNGTKWHTTHFMFMTTTQYKTKKKTYCCSLFAVGIQNDHTNRF